MNSGMICYPRIFYAMAEDRLFFRGIAAVHPIFGTPHTAIALTAALAMCFLWVRTFEQLIEVFILGSLPFWALAAGAVLVLRGRHPDQAPPYRCPGYPVVPIVFIAANGGLLLNSLWQRPGPAVGSIAAILLGIPVFYFWRGR
jgi:APA family basic amino acid/polyamine antiporter